jgi:hypothetical protein
MTLAEGPSDSEGTNTTVVTEGLEKVSLSLLTADGTIHGSSGLNWSFRGTGKNRKELNEAYIPVPATIYKTDFFPPKKVRFSVLTDDGKIFICVRAQEAWGKAIETPENNSLLGRYFRDRIGVLHDTPVTEKHLVDYGRTTVDFYKLDLENYYMDFSLSH